ncbi:MAG TPA: bifunctional YncE family protein/alkaline phosphatase family protein [Pseudonocardiaceae bacterium]|nr:bifunctional YncE family protein/alkaline phosphatase family protein [Pseudonocardiaceae bacterium]
MPLPRLTTRSAADVQGGWVYRWAKRRWRLVVATAVATTLALGGTALAVGLPHAGPGPDGTAVTPIGFTVTPAGQQTNLGDLPLAAASSPDGRWLVVSNDGQGTQSLQVVDTTTSKVTQTLPYTAPQALFVGLAFAQDGKTLYASGGGNNLIRRYTVTNGMLTEGTPIPLPTTNPAGATLNPVPAGIAVTPDGQRLLVADQQANAMSVVDLATGVVHTTAAGPHPYAVVVSADGHSAYVTDQGADTVSVLDLTGPEPAAHKTITVGTHPNKAVASADGSTLYVANGDSDEISVIDTATATVSRTINLAPYPGAPVGSNPDALALSGDGRTLYVANAGNNDVAVIDLASGRVAGLIPTAWYPTAVVATDRALFVTNGKGLGAGPNNVPRHYPNPYDASTPTPDQYVGSMMVGTLSTVSLPINHGQLTKWTQQVAHDDGFNGSTGDHGQASAIVPGTAGQRSPIQHVIYVVKENRTYDQEFGSLGKGNGDPTLNLFGPESAPNARTLEGNYVTLDNFYADAEVSAQGWNWTVAANSNPYSEQVWPGNYSGRGAPYPSESSDPAIAPNRVPAQAYIWDRLAAAHISFRNYGFYVNTQPNGSSTATDPVLDANTDHNFRGFDLACPDSPNSFTPRKATCGGRFPDRFTEWQTEFSNYVQNNNLPTVELVRLPNDHNAGTTVGAPTPRAYTADNDWAVGQLVQAVSHSKYWPNTAIFVTEDDAQNGPDHVDAHRTVAEVISPYTHTGRVDSTFYSTASMLRTIELIVGLHPLTQFDAYATPMLAAFTNKPDTTAYTAIKPSQNLHEVNPVNAPLVAQSAQQDLTKEDQINMQQFNQATWASVKGANVPMPAPQHHVFPAPVDDQASTAPMASAAGQRPATTDGDDH